MSSGANFASIDKSGVWFWSLDDLESNILPIHTRRKYNTIATKCQEMITKKIFVD